MTHTLLLVDDEPRILAALRRTLRGEKYRVLTTSDPVEALEILDREHVDVLVSDIDMPQISGAELIARVRLAHPNVVRILLTGRGSLETAMTAINAGEVFRYLTKPWDEKELRETLAQAVLRLDELRRVAAADRAATRRSQLLAELEREHPGICKVARTNGVYVLDEASLNDLTARFKGTTLARLLTGW